MVMKLGFTQRPFPDINQHWSFRHLMEAENLSLKILRVDVFAWTPVSQSAN